MRSIPISDFRDMCRDQETERASRLAAGGTICQTCGGTGTKHGPRTTTIFGCRDCGGIGATAPNFFSTYSDLNLDAVEQSRDPFAVPAVQAAQHKEPLFNFVFDANKHLTTAIGARTVPTEKEAELCT